MNTFFIFSPAPIQRRGGGKPKKQCETQKLVLSAKIGDNVLSVSNIVGTMNAVNCLAVH